MRQNLATNNLGQTDDIRYGLADVYFDNTEITDIQGKTCELRYRGYSIHWLTKNPSFEKVAYLLLHGEWPTRNEHETFRAALTARRTLPPDVLDLLEKLRAASPTAALRTAISFWGARTAMDAVNTAEQRYARGLDLIGMIPSMVAAHSAARAGRPAPEPDPTLDHASDFLRGLTGRTPSAFERRLMNLDFVLHADHGANASTFAARVVASTEADLPAAISAAVGALAGRLHGGAVQGAVEMLDGLGSPEAARAYVAKQQTSGQPVMGFGHRVYRGEDPRARYFREAAATLCSETGDRRLLDTLEAVVDAMQPYTRLGVGVNVDLYAAVVYRLLGLVDDLFTAVFAAARAVGWVAQVLEQADNNILIRPRLKYVGPPPRDLP